MNCSRRLGFAMPELLRCGIDVLKESKWSYAAMETAALALPACVIALISKKIYVNLNDINDCIDSRCWTTLVLKSCQASTIANDRHDTATRVLYNYQSTYLPAATWTSQPRECPYCALH